MSPTAVWEVGLFGATLPAIVLLLLVRSVAERLVPGYGTAAALVVGTGCLFAVLATMFFAHVLSTCLGFAAFAVLFHARRGPPRLASGRGGRSPGRIRRRRGVPAAIVAAVIGLYAVLGTRPCSASCRLCRRSRRRRRAASRLQHVGVRLTDDLAYTNAVIQPGSNGHAVVGANALDSSAWAYRACVRRGSSCSRGTDSSCCRRSWLLPRWGRVARWTGTVPKRRRRRCRRLLSCSTTRRTTSRSAALPPGPRFLVPAVPFLAIGVAAAWRSRPVLTVTCSSRPSWSPPSRSSGIRRASRSPPASWFHRVERGDVTRTVFDWISGSHATVAVVPVVLLLAAAVAIGLAVTPRFRVDARAIAVALAALVAWRIVYTGANVMFNVDAQTGGWAGLARSARAGGRDSARLPDGAEARGGGSPRAPARTDRIAPFAAHTGVHARRDHDRRLRDLARALATAARRSPPARAARQQLRPPAGTPWPGSRASRQTRGRTGRPSTPTSRSA